MNNLRIMLAVGLLAFAVMAFAGDVEKAPYPPGTGISNEPRTLDDEDGRVLGGKEVKVRHRVEGTISRISHDTGRVVLETESGPLQLLFPPEEIRRFENGQHFATTMELWPGEPAVSRAGDAPGSGLPGDDYTLTGNVVSIDKEQGRLEVATTKGAVSLHFPRDSVQALKEKDRVTVTMRIEEPGSDTKKMH